jgi:class 3 adenylate cyclase
MSATPPGTAVGPHLDMTDRVLATVLVTDVVGSTAQASRLGDERWTTLLEHHDALARTAVECFEGQLVKTTGDGILAIFLRPSLAVAAAAAVRTLVTRLGLQIRAGVHTGEVQLRAGDIAGIAVHIAERVSRQAQPNEILVSAAVKDLVLGSPIEFGRGRRHTLRGIPGSWRLFAVSDNGETVPASVMSEWNSGGLRRTACVGTELSPA